jgi:hypothetical protein
MKRVIFVFGFLIISFFVIKCSSGEREENAENSNSREVEVNAINSHEGFDSVNKLTQSVIESIKNKDYEMYITHVMSREGELAQSKLIENDTLRQEFINEFSFSLHVEEEYFNKMIKFLNNSEVNLDRSIIEESILIDFEENKYLPCKLVEVIVPIEHDEMETDLVYVAIQIRNKWFLTAELSI